ncbi:MAG: hypothetical protein LBG24_09305 [Treponema sp.]|jgi:hypothetical protein|nr:hypothetical protein [Treponema sp.]
MRKKVFLAGIISLGLIFALVFSACKSDDDSNSGNQSGGGGNSLLGTWGNNQDLTNAANLTSVIVFTDTASTAAGVASGTKLAYYASNLVSGGSQGTSGNDTIITLGQGQGQAQPPQGTGPYTVTGLQANQFTLSDYESQGVDVTFKRATGTSGSGFRGIWISDVTSSNAAYTILLIGGVDGKTVWSSYTNNAQTPNYLATVDPATTNTVISWNGGNSNSYIKSTIGNNITLNITLPGANVPLNTYPLFTTPTF